MSSTSQYKHKTLPLFSGTNTPGTDRFLPGRADVIFNSTVASNSDYAAAAVREHPALALLNAEPNFQNPLNEFEDERHQRMIVCLLCDLPREMGTYHIICCLYLHQGQKIRVSLLSYARGKGI